MPPISVLLEGWRFIPHSYAIINQWQCLELVGRPGIEVFMRDLPFYAPNRWKQVRGLLPAAEEERIARLSAPPPDGRRDATLRISVPVRFRPARHGRTYVLGTADFGWLPRVMIGGGRTLKEAHAGTDVVIVTPSEWSKHGLLRAGADPGRVAVVPHGFAPDVFRPPVPEERAALRAARRWQDKFVFLNVSAMSLSKGTDLMLKA